MDFLLGLDIGTTNCKALAIDLDGKALSVRSAPTPVLPPEGDSGVAQMYDADQLWSVTAGLIQQTLESLGPAARCAGVAVASMGESGVLVDRQGKPLAPILPWYDPRTRSYAGWWQERIPEAELYRRTGLPLDHIYSAMKLQWSRDHQPEAFAKASGWLCISDWITFRLSEERAASYSIASRTMLFDLRSRSWCQEILDLAGIPPRLLPDIYPSGALVGGVTPRAARQTGLAPGTPVVSGGHDHICAALAAGVIQPGSVLDSAGTAEAMLVTLDQPVTNPEMMASGLCCGCHSARDRYYILGGVLGGGVVNWLARLFYGDASQVEILMLAEEAAKAPPGAGGVWFQPYLEGSGPPERDAATWGAWLGLKLNHGRPALARAAMEGLCFGFRKLLETLLVQAGYRPAALRAVGGSTRIQFLQALKANVLGLPIDVPAMTDITALGAALLAGIGAGVYADDVEASQKGYFPASHYEVDPQLAAFYEHSYREVYRNLYPALKSIHLGAGETAEKP